MSTLANILLGYKNSAWFTTNATLVLLAGQIVYLDSTGQYKIGDGTTQLSALTFNGFKTNPRVVSQTSTATITPNADTTDLHKITALAVSSVFTTPTGTPVDGQCIRLRVKDNGTARALSFDSGYRHLTTAPTTTTVNKEMYLDICYDSIATKWDVTGWANVI